MGTPELLAAPNPATTDWVPLGPPPPITAFPAKLGDILATGPVANIDFTSIPAGYSSLRVVVSARTVASTTVVLGIRFNNDSATNYYSQILSSTGTATPVSSQANAIAYGNLGPIPGTNSVAGLFGTIVVDFPMYSDTVDTVWKTWTSSGGLHTYIYVVAGVWNSFSTAVNRVTLLTNDLSNLAKGSRAILWGF